MLKIENYGYSYGEKNVLSNLSLEIKEGELIAIVGPNGAGKTTLMKSLTAINTDYKGEIVFQEKKQLDDLVSFKKRIGFVADEPLLLDYLTGIQYLNFIADIYEVSEGKREKYIMKYAKVFEMSDILGELIKTYSHGNKQKLAIVAALIHEPKVLILDEPFVGLDPKAIKDLTEILIELRNGGTIIVMATHILSMVDGLCTKVMLINNNKTLLVNRDKKTKKTLEKIYMEFIDV